MYDYNNKNNDDLKFALLVLLMAFSVLFSSLFNVFSKNTKEPHPVWDSIYITKER